MLHGPVNIGNQPWTLSRAERLVGLDSRLVVNYSTWLGYPADRVLGQYGKKSFREMARRFLISFHELIKADVVHYYFGRTFWTWDDWGYGLHQSGLRGLLPRLELYLLRLLGKRIFLTLQGCDARLASESNSRNQITPCAEGRCGAYLACVELYDRQRQVMLREFVKITDRIFILNPELGWFTSNARFLPYANVDIDAVQVIGARPIGRRLRLVHAPSDQSTKGTRYLLRALDSLRDKLAFDLLLVEKMSHTEALAMYASADVAIDQLLYGWYGGFAVELMAMGKPVIAYIRNEDKEHVPDGLWKELPILKVNLDTLTEDLFAILTDRNRLADAGRRSRSFVERWHSPKAIATAMLREYKEGSGGV